MGMYVLTVNERTKIVWESGQKSPYTDDFFIIAGFTFSLPKRTMDVNPPVGHTPQ